MTECTNTFDGEHHYSERTWWVAGNPRETKRVLACVCGKECPPELRDSVRARLAETDLEKERQRFPVRRPSERGYGQPPRYTRRIQD